MRHAPLNRYRNPEGRLDVHLCGGRHDGYATPGDGWRETGTMKQFFLEGEMAGVPGLVRWFVRRPADGALLLFDEERAQEMFCSNVATVMFLRLEVKEADAPLTSAPAEGPAYRATLKGGVVAVGYLVARS